jgi:predicted MPP superfamily phosphohydrolase
MYGGGRQTPRNKAVAAVLGGDLYQRTRREGMRAKGDVDVEVLLEGAERLLNVYAIPGANESISSLRRRYEQLRNNIAYHEQRVAKQSEELAGRRGYGDVEEEEFEEGGNEHHIHEDVFMSAEDLEAEEKEVRELEAKKRALEERVAGMEKDLGGLMR